MDHNKRLFALIIFLLITVAAYLSVHSETLKNTGLKLRLWGTITGSNISAYAIIEDMTTRQQKLYRQGEFAINASADEMRALLTVEPPLGGADVLSSIHNHSGLYHLHGGCAGRPDAGLD